jgi:hypothetical protein
MTSRAFLHIGVLRAASRVMLAAALPALGACASTTLFQSSFNSQPTFAPPTAAQLVGTMQLISGDSGRIQVEPGGGTGPSENLLRISRLVLVPNTNTSTPASVVQGTLAQTFPDGNYGFLGVFDIGQGSGLASLEFDANPQGPVAESFLHLDFMQDGSVRFDDDPSATCCHYSASTPFTLSVSIQVTASSAVAHVTLFGQGVSQGTYDYTIKHPNLATRFSAFRLWMGFPWTGAFEVTDLVVTRHN